MKPLTWIFILLLSYGCSTTSYIDGSSVLLAPQGASVSTISPDDVTIYLQPPEQSYEPVALVVASATVSSYSDVALTEAELIRELKRQAAATGANAVIDVVREVIAGDQVISISGWGIASRSDIIDADRRLKNIITDTRQQGVITSDYLIIYRGKAVSTANKPIR